MEDFPPIPNINTSSNTFFHDDKGVREKATGDKPKATHQAKGKRRRSGSVRRPKVSPKNEQGGAKS